MAQCARSTTIHPTCPALEVASISPRCGANDAREWVVESRWLDEGESAMRLTLIISTHGGWVGTLAGTALDAALGAISYGIYSRFVRMFEMDQRGQRCSR